MPEWDSRHRSSLTHGGAQSVSVPRTWWGTAQIHAYGPPPRTRLRGKEWQSGILAFSRKQSVAIPSPGFARGPRNQKNPRAPGGQATAIGSLLAGGQGPAMVLGAPIPGPIPPLLPRRQRRCLSPPGVRLSEASPRGESLRKPGKCGARPGSMRSAGLVYSGAVCFSPHWPSCCFRPVPVRRAPASARASPGGESPRETWGHPAQPPVQSGRVRRKLLSAA